MRGTLCEANVEQRPRSRLATCSATRLILRQQTRTSAAISAFQQVLFTDPSGRLLTFGTIRPGRPSGRDRVRAWEQSQTPTHPRSSPRRQGQSRERRPSSRIKVRI